MDSTSSTSSDFIKVRSKVMESSSAMDALSSVGGAICMVRAFFRKIAKAVALALVGEREIFDCEGGHASV